MEDKEKAVELQGLCFARPFLLSLNIAFTDVSVIWFYATAVASAVTKPQPAPLIITLEHGSKQMLKGKPQYQSIIKCVSTHSGNTQ